MHKTLQKQSGTANASKEKSSKKGHYLMPQTKTLIPQSDTLIQRKENLHQTRKPNNTGIPAQLKENFEAKSGYSFDDVKVHYNSDKPAQLQAHAYTQDSQVYMGPSQEKHLSHELGHIVQQKQGRVQPTMQLQGVYVNDDTGLEKEADVMGANATQLQGVNMDGYSQLEKKTAPMSGKPLIQRKISLVTTSLNVVGELHPESNQRRNEEIIMCREKGGAGYWGEDQFKARDPDPDSDPTLARLIPQADTVVNRCDYIIRLLVGEGVPNESNFKNCITFAEILVRLFISLENNSRVDVQRDQLILLKPLIIALGNSARLLDPADKPTINAYTSALSSFKTQSHMTIPFGEDRTAADSLEIRSNTMHVAANLRATSTLGVWKVGEKHQLSLSGYSSSATNKFT